MNKELWTGVESYINEKVVKQDKSLADALADSKAAGLPGIQVTPNHEAEFIEALRPTHRWEWRDGRLVMRQSSMARVDRECLPVRLQSHPSPADR